MLQTKYTPLVEHVGKFSTMDYQWIDLKMTFEFKIKFKTQI